MRESVVTFLALMQQFNITHIDTVFNKLHPRQDQLFHGVDDRTRNFINIPIIVNSSDYVTQNRIRELTTNENIINSTFIVYQRFVDSNIFSIIRSNLDPMTPHGLLGNRLNNFAKLEKLLSGEILRFYEIPKYINKKPVIIPDRWIEISRHNI